MRGKISTHPPKMSRRHALAHRDLAHRTWYTEELGTQRNLVRRACLVVVVLDDGRLLAGWRHEVADEARRAKGERVHVLGGDAVHLEGGRGGC